MPDNDTLRPPQDPSVACSFNHRIRHILPLLPPSEKRLGEFVLRFSGDFAAYSASELAEMVGVSNATVSRFIRRLGYENYEAARLHVRSESHVPDVADESGQTHQNYWDATLSLAENNLRQTLSGLSGEEVSNIADAMIKARRVCFFGTRNNHNFASYLRWQLLQVIPCADVLPGAGETLGEYLPGFNQDDVLVVFDLRRSQPVTEHFSRLAQQQGVKILYITDNYSHYHLSATWVLRCETSSVGPIDNHVAAMMLCHILASRVIQRVSASGKQRLAFIEQAHDNLKEL
jgi:DNA-binding MurR/RpiR family transcriptional regulator